MLESRWSWVWCCFNKNVIFRLECFIIFSIFSIARVKKITPHHGKEKVPENFYRFSKVLLLLLLLVNSLLVFHISLTSDFSLSDSKFLQVSRTLLSILADLKSVGIKITSILSQILSWSSLFSSRPRLSITICTTVTFMLYRFQLSSKIQAFVYLLAFFYFQSMVFWNDNID